MADDLEVSEAKGRKLFVDAPVSDTVSLDLRVPEAARLTPVVVGVAVPKGAVDEHGDTPPYPG